MGKPFNRIRNGVRIDGNDTVIDNVDIEVIIEDDSNNILIARGNTVPDADPGFAKGCTFIKIDAANGTRALYQNIGTTSSCSFEMIGQNEQVNADWNEDDAQSPAFILNKPELGGSAMKHSLFFGFETIADEVYGKASGSAPITLGGGWVTLPCDKTGGNVALTRLGFSYGAFGNFFDRKFVCTAQISFAMTLSGTHRFSFSPFAEQVYTPFAGAWTAVHAGFVAYTENGECKVYATTGDGSVENKVFIGNVDAFETHMYTVKHNPGVSDEFFVDGVLVATINESIPGGQAGNGYFTAETARGSNTTVSGAMHLGNVGIEYEL